MAGSARWHRVPGARSEGRRNPFLKNARPARPGSADPHYEGSFSASLEGGEVFQTPGLDMKGAYRARRHVRLLDASQDMEPVGTSSGHGADIGVKA